MNLKTQTSSLVMFPGRIMVWSINNREISGTKGTQFLFLGRVHVLSNDHIQGLEWKKIAQPAHLMLFLSLHPAMYACI